MPSLAALPAMGPMASMPAMAMSSSGGGFFAALANLAHRAINFILESLHIDPRRFWELLDQVGASAGKLISSGLSIARKLISGTAKGVENFFANFGQHAKEGVYTWLFGDLAINWDLIPARWDDWSGWAEFFADLVGLSWDKILTAAQTRLQPRDRAGAVAVPERGRPGG